MTDLLTLAEAQIAEKQYEEIKKVKERLEKDKETIIKAIQMVKEHTLYKKVRSQYNSSFKYVLATEEMLKEDYLKKPKDSWYQKGISFKDVDEYKNRYGVLLTVNGEAYYDIRYALENYEETMNEKKQQILRLNEKIRELEDDLSNLKRDFPTLKKAIEEWQEYQNSIKTED